MAELGCFDLTKVLRLCQGINSTALVVRRGGGLESVLPSTSSGLIGTVRGYSRTQGHTRRRLRCSVECNVRPVAVGSRHCPRQLGSYSSTPLVLFCGNGTGLGRRQVVGVIKAHRYAPCNRSLVHHFVASLGRLSPHILVIDNLTCNISVITRERTLTDNCRAINILTRNLSSLCPHRRQRATTGVVRRNNLLARFLAHAGTSGVGFIHHGQVITKVSSTYVLVRDTTRNKNLVAYSVSRSCNESIFAFPNEVNSCCDRNYGGLVHGGNTALVADTRSFIGSVH